MVVMKIGTQTIIFLIIAVFFFGCKPLPKENRASTQKQRAGHVIINLPVVETHEKIDGARGDIVYTLKPVLSWDCLMQSGITGYELVISKSSDFGSIDINRNIPVSGECSFTIDVDLTDKTIYYWRLRAKNNEKKGPWSKIRKFSVDFSFIPPPPKLKNPLQGAKDYPLQPTFEWFYEPRATEHQIEVSDSDSEFKDKKAIVISSNISGTLFVSNVKLDPGKTYFWRVRSLRAGVPGSFGEIRKFTTIADTLPPKIEVISATEIITQQVPAFFDMKVIAVDEGNPAVGTQKVEFYVDNVNACVLQSADNKTGIYRCGLNGLSEGIHKIIIIAHDKIGNKTQLPVDLKVTVKKNQKK